MADVQTRHIVPVEVHGVFVYKSDLKATVNCNDRQDWMRLLADIEAESGDLYERYKPYHDDKRVSKDVAAEIIKYCRGDDIKVRFLFD